MKYKNLSVLNDTVFFSNNTKDQFCYSEKDILKITKTGTCVTEGAIVMGLNGILLGFIFNQTEVWNSFYQSQILTQMLLFGLAGGLIGVLIPNEIMMFKNSSKISFYPEIKQLPYSKPGLMIMCSVYF